MSRNGTITGTGTSTTRTAELEELPGLSFRWPDRRSWCQQACPCGSYRASPQPAGSRCQVSTDDFGHPCRGLRKL